MTFAEKVDSYWYFSRRYSQYEVLSSLIDSSIHENSSLSLRAQKALIELDKNRADCQSRIGELKLSSVADCQSCKGRCCDRPSDEYFSAVDFWLGKYVDGRECVYSSEATRKPGYYVRQRLQHIVHEARNKAGRVFRRSRRNAFPIAAIRYQRATRRSPGCQFLGENGCTLSYAERPIRCVIYACPRMQRGLQQPVKTQYMREIGELYRISNSTFQILRAEKGRPKWWVSVLLKVVP